MRTLLSIDNDFFPWYGGYDPAVEVTHPDGTPGTLHGLQLFDWSHSEGALLGGFYRDIVWGLRGSGFANAGLDFERTYNVRPEKGCVSYSEFALTISGCFDLEGISSIADSHVNAVRAIMRRPEPVDVIHFDAHHDLGYGERMVAENAKRGEANCGDWLYQMLRAGWVGHATIVYPEWCREERPGSWIEPYADRITWTTWQEWLKADHDVLTDVEVFTCRSGSWAPPWLDREWLDLAARLGEVVNIDDSDEAVAPREWNSEAMREQFKAQAEVFRAAISEATDTIAAKRGERA